jgi:hypothetical protein
VQDWFFNGGHGIAPDNLKLACLNWLVSQRTPAGLSDPSNALAQAASWRTRAAAGQSEAVFRECVTTLMNQPRTWFALEAQLVMDDLMTNYNSFRWLNVSNLVPATDSFITNDFSSNTNTWSQSDLASDLFYYAARGAGNNNDRQRYYACLKALTGIANVNGDRYGDLYSLLTTNGGYPAPVLRASAVPASGQICVRLQKDTPSLSYTLQTRARLANDVWQSAFPSTIVDTDTIWSGQFDLDAGATNGFYRVGTVPTPLGDSPPWPPL